MALLKNVRRENMKPNKNKMKLIFKYLCKYLIYGFGLSPSGPPKKHYYLHLGKNIRSEIITCMK